MVSVLLQVCESLPIAAPCGMRIGRDVMVMPRRGDNIYKRKDGRWEGRFVKSRDNGKAELGYVFGKTYNEAKEKLVKAKYEHRMLLDSREQQKTTVGVLGTEWLQEAEAFVKESTAVRYRDYLRCYIFPAFGDKSIGDLDNQEISDFCNNLMTSGGIREQGLSTKTVAEALRILKYLRKYALQHGYMVGFTADCAVIRQKSPPIRVFTPTERKQLVSYLSDNESVSNIGIYLCLCTGIRIGELCALRWDDISLTEQQLHIHATLQRVRKDDTDSNKTSVIITSPKSASSIRTIPLTQNICDKLADSQKPGTFFLTGDADRFVEPRTMQNRFKAVLAECGIVDANFHALRHTFATECVEAGFDVKCLSEILGHSNVNITLNRYVHSTMDLKRQNMAKLPM